MHRLTQEAYKELRQKVEWYEERLERITRDKSESHQGQDGWHDEGFKIGQVEEEKYSQRLGELQAVLSNAEVISPKEQDERIGLGSGVKVRYEDGSEEGFILDGYFFGVRISVQSPLAKAIMGAKEREERSFEVAGKEKKVKIVKILTPSLAKKTFERGG